MTVIVDMHLAQSLPHDLKRRSGIKVKLSILRPAVVLGPQQSCKSKLRLAIDHEVQLQYGNLFSNRKRNLANIAGNPLHPMFRKSKDDLKEPALISRSVYKAGSQATLCTEC